MVGASAFRFGVAAGRVRSSAFRFGVATGRVRSSVFRFGDCHSSGWPSGSPLPFSACAASEWPLGELVLPPSASEWPSAGWSSGSLLPLFGMHRFGVAAGRVRSFAFRFGNCPRRVGLRAHRFRFSARTASEIALGGLAFGLTASAFRHAPIRGGRWASSFFRLPLRKLPSAGWPSGSLLPLFGTHRFGDCLRRVRSSAFRFGDCPRRVGLRVHRFRFSACADPHRRAAETRTDGAQRHDNCFTSKHLSQHVNLPHRTP